MALRLTLDIFSGRPNPVVVIDGPEEKELLQRIGTGKKARPASERFPAPLTHLGYRGVLIEPLLAPAAHGKAAPPVGSKSSTSLRVGVGAIVGRVVVAVVVVLDLPRIVPPRRLPQRRALARRALRPRPLFPWPQPHHFVQVPRFIAAKVEEEGVESSQPERAASTAEELLDLGVERLEGSPPRVNQPAG